MKIQDVRKLSPIDRFLYWCRERYQIYLRRKNGRPKPWTDDEILQNYFFTMPYREKDKTTVWFRENVRDPLRDDPDVIFATAAFRWFNYIPTGEILACKALRRNDIGLKDSFLCRWDADEVFVELDAERRQGRQVFTGAYMINSPAREGKLEAIIRRVTNVWNGRNQLRQYYCADALGMKGKPVSLELFHKVLTQFEGMGGFMAYEVVTDLRHTYLLENAPDIMTWCHVGPGARRGLYRVLGLDFPKGNNASGCPRLLKPQEEIREMRKLLYVCNNHLRGMPPFEMREIEHSCCEADKYSRALDNDGRLKRKYHGA